MSILGGPQSPDINPQLEVARDAHRAYERTKLKEKIFVRVYASAMSCRDVGNDEANKLAMQAVADLELFLNNME